MTKQKIFIDIDNTILPLIEEIIIRYNLKYCDNVSSDKITDYDISKHIKPQCTSIFKEFASDDLFGNVIPYEGAVESMVYLNSKYELYFVSAGHPNSMKFRDKWLDKHFNFYSSAQLVMLRNKKMLNGDLLIDDYIENLIGGSYEKLLFRMPWNDNVPKSVLLQNTIYNIDSWSESSLRVIDNIMEHRERKNSY